MAYMSAFIQKLTNIDSIPLLLLRHRQALVLFGLVFSSIITIRFGYIGVLYAFLYESSKYYLFGDRFLAEGFIPYPLVYMLFVLLHKKNITWVDSLFVTISAWFVMFMREPYVPLALFLYFGYLFVEMNNIRKFFSIVVFMVFCVILLNFTLIHDYIFNVITVNAKTVFIADTNTTGLFGIGGLKIIFYPFLIIFGAGIWNPFRIFLSILAAQFVLISLYVFFVQKKRKLIIFIWLILATANLRYSPPGQLFYSSFHMLPWYSLFLGAILFLVTRLSFRSYSIKPLYISMLLVIFGVGLLLQPKSYIYEKIQPHEELITNYGKILEVSTVIKTITTPTNTVFIDGSDDLIYLAANRLSGYRYSWYTSVMPAFNIYNSARIEMFNSRPPDIYYRYCSEKILPQYFLPEKIRGSYTTLYYDSKPSCLYVRTAYIKSVSDSQWQEAANLGYSYNK